MHVGARLSEYDGKHGAFGEFPSRESGDCPRGFRGLTRIDVTRALRELLERSFPTFDSRNARVFRFFGFRRAGQGIIKLPQ